MLPRNTGCSFFGNMHYTSNTVRNFEQYRHFSNRLTHVNENGELNMVDVSFKTKSVRNSEAEARIYLGPEAFKLVSENKVKKGNVLSVANIAGILAAKKTSELIPLCHSINIDHVKLEFTLLPIEHEILIKSSVRTSDRTGVEMEALTSATVAALTIYDMCKAVTKEMVIKYVILTMKSGGKNDYKKS